MTTETKHVPKVHAVPPPCCTGLGITRREFVQGGGGIAFALGARSPLRDSLFYALQGEDESSGSDYLPKELRYRYFATPLARIIRHHGKFIARLTWLLLLYRTCHNDRFAGFGAWYSLRQSLGRARCGDRNHQNLAATRQQVCRKLLESGVLCT